MRTFFDLLDDVRKDFEKESPDDDEKTVKDITKIFHTIKGSLGVNSLEALDKDKNQAFKEAIQHGANLATIVKPFTDAFSYFSK